MLTLRLALVAVVCGLWIPAAVATDPRAPTFSSAGVVNAATGQATLAPYSVCSIYGTDLFLNGAASAMAGAEAPGSLAGVQVVIGSVPAGIFYVSANQINLLIPNSLLPGAYSVRVFRDGVTASQPVPIVIQEVAPGLFATQPGFAAAFHADSTPVAENSPAVPGEIVVLYGTGLGRTQPDQSDRAFAVSAAQIVHLPDFQVLLDGAAIDPSLVQYAGVSPFSAGLYQVNVRMPGNLAATNPEIQVSVAGSVSAAGLRLVTGPVSP